MSAFCIHLDDDTPLFVEGYQHPHYPERCHVDVDPAAISPYWYQLMERNGLYLLRVELFYGPPDTPYTLGIHIDHSYGDRSKINWVFGGEGSTMHWYRPLAAHSKEVQFTPVHSNYTMYEPNEVKLIHSNVIRNPSLVQAGVPHNIINPGKERWCYSMVIMDPATNDNATFGRIKKIFGK
jgi:hypothetical protein